MIVRILGDAQYRIDEETFAKVNKLDDELQKAIDDGDAPEFARALLHLTSTIRDRGTEVGVDEFVPSDAIIPDADTTMDEAKDLLGEEGLVPDSM